MGKPPCHDVPTPSLHSLSPLRPLPPPPSLRSLPAPARTLRQRYRRGQLLAVGANAMGLAQSVGLLLSAGEGWRTLWLAIAGVIAITLTWNVLMLSLNGISY